MSSSDAPALRRETTARRDAGGGVPGPAGEVEILLVAGEASGDLHGARLLAELGRAVPGLSAFGLGADELQAAGLDALVHSGRLAAVGVGEALKVVPFARRVFRRLLAEVDARGTSTAVLIDFPEFNLRLAQALKERGVRVFYYISPQLWAWRRGRVRIVAECVDTMLVLFPFEVEFYRRHGIEAIHVGHPLLDEVPELEQTWDRPGGTEPPYHVALMPGSRMSELRSILPLMLAAARLLERSVSVRFSLVRAPTVPPEALQGTLAAARLPVEVVERDRFRHLASAHLALCASGTATLELGLLRTPTIVLYRVGLLSHLLGRLLIRTPHVSLVNLVLEREVFPELLQGAGSPERVARRAAGLLGNPAAVAAMRDALRELRPRLGEGGASRRAAAVVAEALAGEPAA